MLSHAFTLVLGIVLGLWSAHRANKQLAAELKHEQATIRGLGRELHHAGVSIARRDDEIERLEAKLLEAQATNVVFGGDDPEAA